MLHRPQIPGAQRFLFSSLGLGLLLGLTGCADNAKPPAGRGGGAAPVVAGKVESADDQVGELFFARILSERLFMLLNICGRAGPQILAWIVWIRRVIAECIKFVITHYNYSIASVDHCPCYLDRTANVGTAIDKIPEEDEFSFRVPISAAM
jgi:hypothetical protein